MPNIAIVWDFDGTLTPDDSTTKVVEIFKNEGGNEFWKFVKSFYKGQTPSWQHILASDAPIWMFSLSKEASQKNIPLNKEFFKQFVLPEITLYENSIEMLKNIKSLSEDKRFKNLNISIHHFIVTAGLKDLVEQVFPIDLITWTFGCRYEVIKEEGKDTIENVPVFCMDETMKTRSIFEIAKGVFQKEGIKVNTRVEKNDLWANFENFIYIGDGDTDVPALSLVRDKGGIGIAVYNKEKSPKEIQKRLHNMRLDKRADLITPADFSLDGELHTYLNNRCIQILQRYEAERIHIKKRSRIFESVRKIIKKLH